MRNVQTHLISGPLFLAKRNVYFFSSHSHPHLHFEDMAIRCVTSWDRASPIMGSPSPFSFYQHSDHVLIEETDTGAENLSPSASTSQQPTCQFVPNLSDTANQYHRTAIYANSTSNFTTLAIVGNLPGNEYFDYMYAPYAKIKDGGNDDHVIVDDDEDLPDETWLEKASVLASQWKKDFASWSCRRRWPVLMRRTMQRQFCFAEWEYPPQGPRSRYRHLLSQSRMNRLRNLMPKWFR